MAFRVLLSLLLFACSPEGERELDAEDVPVRVGMVALDAHASPVVVLEEEDGPRWLPIWIGTAEARSIAAKMEDRAAPRPNTHDLAQRVIQRLEGEVTRVVVTELRGGTYYAILAIRVRGQLVEIDSRPSDAIAIALRSGAPILVRAELFEEGGHGLLPDDPERSVRWSPPGGAQPVGTAPATPAWNL